MTMQEGSSNDQIIIIEKSEKAIKINPSLWNVTSNQCRNTCRFENLIAILRHVTIDSQNHGNLVSPEIFENHNKCITLVLKWGKCMFLYCVRKVYFQQFWVNIFCWRMVLITDYKLVHSAFNGNPAATDLLPSVSFSRHSWNTSSFFPPVRQSRRVEHEDISRVIGTWRLRMETP